MLACPPLNMLHGLIQGELPAESASSVRLHLETCPTCLDVLDRMTDDPELNRWMASGLRDTLKSADRASKAERGAYGVTGPLLLLNPPAHPGDLGTLGPYEIEAEIGRGGMGVVYRARDRTLGRLVALKVLRQDVDDERLRERFAREVRASARVEHDHLVRVYATSEPSDAVLYFAMEYVSGLSLASYIRAQSRLVPREAAKLVAQAAQGLAAAHDAGLVHRDIKPDNILIDSARGRAKVGDFGLARLAAEVSELTREGVVAGTPAYLSPEQARGDRDAGPLADVYALGVTLYECLAGEVPFRGAAHRVVQQILNDEPRSPKALNDLVPRDLENICLKAMSKEPHRRYASASEFYQDLHRYLRGEPVRARPTGTAFKLWRLARRKPLATALLLAFVLALLGGSIISTIFWRRAEANAALAVARGNESARNFRNARDAVDNLYLKFYSDGLLNKPGLETVRAEIAREILQYYREFLREHADDVSLRADMTEAALRVGYLTTIHGDKRDALDALEQASVLLEATIRDQPSDLKKRREFGKCLDQMGFLLDQLGRPAEGMHAHLRASQVYSDLIDADPNDPFWRRLLAHSFGNIANAHLQAGNRAEAHAAYLKAREQIDALLKVDPENRGYRADLAMTLNNMSMTADGDAQILILREGLAIREVIAAEIPEDTYAKRNLARTRFNLAISLSGLERFEESLDKFDAAIVALREIRSQYSEDLTHCRELAAALHERAKASLALGRYQAAEDTLREAIQLYMKAAEIDPADATYRVFLIDACSVFADAHMHLGHIDKALNDCQGTLLLCEQAVKIRPDDPKAVEGVSKIRRKIAELLERNLP